LGKNSAKGRGKKEGKTQLKRGMFTAEGLSSEFPEGDGIEGALAPANRLQAMLKEPDPASACSSSTVGNRRGVAGLSEGKREVPSADAGGESESDASGRVQKRARRHGIPKNK